MKKLIMISLILLVIFLASGSALAWRGQHHHRHFGIFISPPPIFLPPPPIFYRGYYPPPYGYYGPGYYYDYPYRVWVPDHWEERWTPYGWEKVWTPGYWRYGP